MIELPIVDAATSREQDRGQSPRFWRSYSQLKNPPAYQALARQEFMPGASEPPGGASRRQFIQLMGASLAMAGLTACRRPVEHIVPYVRKPEEVIEGIARYYATAMPFRGVLLGILVESHEGRPTKVEGNPEHPVSRGATGLFEQASILNLYDPDRSKAVLREGAAATWNDFVAFCRNELLVGAASKQVAVLCEASSSMTAAALREQLAAVYPSLRWVTYAAEGDDPVRMGTQTAFGQALRPSYDFTGARVVVSLDADFLSSTDPNYVPNARSLAAGRRMEEPGAGMNRLYVVESTFTSTGSAADNRLRLRSSEIPAFAAAVAGRLGLDAGDAGARFADHPYVVEIARDLQEAGSAGVVLAGETQPPEVHALCMAINETLGSLGETVRLYDTGEPLKAPQSEEVRQLVSSMNTGELDALIMIGANPVHSLPADLNFAEALERVTHSIHVGLHVDETALASRWHLPRAHYLEAWGDGRAYDGTQSVIQPLIAPLYEAARSDVEILNVLATGQDVAGYDLVRETWRGLLNGDFEAAWRRVLHDGFLPDSGFDVVEAGGAAAPRIAPVPIGEDELEVVFRLDPTLLDGRFSNNAWCQELPDPVTKIVWDNVAVMSRATAERLGVRSVYRTGQEYVDVVELTVNGNAVTLPIWILPGHADNSITLNLGYGVNIQSLRPERETGFFDLDDYTDIYGHGAIATGVGQNVARLRTVTTMRVAVGAGVQPTGDTYMVATTQDHAYMEGRPLVRMATLEEYRADPDFAPEMVETLPGVTESWEEYPPLWEERHPAEQPASKGNPYYPYQWGMVIDLTTCFGCNACIVACQSENNIQVVGKEEVSRGREMHWLRLDRYFVSDEGEEDDPRMVTQLIPCMHCENAPCESVCPVAATVHSPDGTNQMIYNRCIGTRYCANNCPYKVRRFNFYNWTKTLPVQLHMQSNPHVTVRSRGVMEKCSYCIQRIRQANLQANMEDRAIADGEVMTACQQACAAGAITFGDINNPDSAVSRQKRSERRYEMLAELNVQPRTSYLARIYNPNPRLEERAV